MVEDFSDDEGFIICFSIFLGASTVFSRFLESVSFGFRIFVSAAFLFGFFFVGFRLLFTEFLEVFEEK